ncbi:MAG: undecaprenyl-diphosphate phosphatase, partial [Ruthenibacterium sp.]
MIDIFKAAILGIIEGITEWLPISSTGHLILADELIKLGVTPAFKDVFDVVIQLGAIFAVVVLFWPKLWPFCNNRTESGFIDRYCKKDVWSMWFKVVVATLPAMVIGLPLDDWMTEHLHNPPVVAAMLILYGVFFILLETFYTKGRRFAVRRIHQMTYPIALGIGLFQVLSLVPGTSRSGATILGAMLLGCSRTIAAEFTFFLAIPAMAGASLIKLLKFDFAFTGMEIGIL